MSGRMFRLDNSSGGNKLEFLLRDLSDPRAGEDMPYHNVLRNMKFTPIPLDGEGVTFALLKKLVMGRRIGNRSLPMHELTTGLPCHAKGYAEKVAERLVHDGVLTKSFLHGGESRYTYGMNPERLDDIIGTVFTGWRGTPQRR